MDINELFSFYSNTPDYSQSADYGLGQKLLYFRRDTLVNSYEYPLLYTSVYTDYKNHILGLQKNIKTWNRISLNHSFALSFSAEDSKFWGKIRYFRSFNALTFDSLNRVRTAYEIEKEVQAYRQTRRVGAAYQNSINLDVFKWLRLDVALRHSLHFKFRERLFLKETVKENTLNYEYDEIGFWDDDPSYDISSNNLRLYSKEKPTGNFSTHKGKASLQYDAILHIKPTFVLGKKRKFELYVTAGMVLGTVYGKQYWAGQRGVTYGYGIGYRL